MAHEQSIDRINFGCDSSPSKYVTQCLRAAALLSHNPPENSLEDGYWGYILRKRREPRTEPLRKPLISFMQQPRYYSQMEDDVWPSSTSSAAKNLPYVFSFL
jgi:hypothetical protein